MFTWMVMCGGMSATTKAEILTIVDLNFMKKMIYVCSKNSQTIGGILLISMEKVML